LTDSRILVAVSSPWASEKLLNPIADLTKRLGAEVVVAHVAHPHEEDETESDARKRGEQTLQVLVEGLTMAGVHAESLMLFSNDIPKALLNAARSRNCTLMVLGLSGKSMIQRLLAGNVPNALIQQSEVPVLLCPPDWNGMV